MSRFWSVATVLVGTALMCCEVVTERGKHGGGLATPREAWDAYRDAVYHQRWKDAFRCYTPERQVEEIRVWFGGVESSAEKLAKYAALQRRFGIDPDQIQAKLMEMRAMGATAVELHKYHNEVVSKVKDKETLYAELMTEAYRDVARPPEIPLGELKDIEITGDEAVGHYIERLRDSTVFISGGRRQTHVQSIARFRKIGGRWFVQDSGSDW